MRSFLQLLSWALLPLQCVLAIWPLSNKPPRVEGLLNAASLGLDDFKGRVVAFGDWNGDQYLDLITLSTDLRTVQIWLWNRLKYKYEASHQLNVPSAVHSVVPADFDLDGHLDLLVMSQVQESSGRWGKGSGRDKMLMTVHRGGGELGGFQSSGFKGSTLTTQPVIIDADGSLKPSLLGLTADASMVLWKNNGTDFDVTQSPLLDTRVCTLAHPHSSALVDLDGDCQADIVLHCENIRTGRKQLQVWVRQYDDGFVLLRQLDLPNGAGPVTFADMDRDGTTDIVFPTCTSYSMEEGIGHDCSLNIAYNKQVPMCAGRSSQTTGDRLKCRGWSELCTADDAFTFDFDSDGDSFTSIPVASLSPQHGTGDLQLYVPARTSAPPVPLPLRIGDFNHDGYPDLLFLAHNATAAPSTGGIFGGSRRRPGVQPRLLQNEPCHNSRKECWGLVEAGRRTFDDITSRYAALYDIWDAERVAWLDVDDDGTLDILVQRTGEQDGQHISFVINNVFHDAFFMKTLVLNGACDGDCQPRGNGSVYRGVGAVSPGASLKYTVLNTAGRRGAAHVSQMPQSAYHALMMPYTFAGLGRTNNYVETLFIGTTLTGPDSHSILESLIPNSQVIINPPSSLLAAESNEYGSLKPSTKWRNELFLQPGDWIPYVGATVVIITLLLGGVVILLGEKEKREDEKERRRALHSINFQAL